MEKDTSKGMKFDNGKPRMDLVMIPALIEVSRALGYGANKYNDYNHMKGGLKANQYIAAACRHLVQYNCGEDLDPESGLPHISHACASLLLGIDLILIGEEGERNTEAKDLIKKVMENK